jgi:hypothetical protein
MTAVGVGYVLNEKKSEMHPLPDTLCSLKHRNCEPLDLGISLCAAHAGIAVPCTSPMAGVPDVLKVRQKAAVS